MILLNNKKLKTLELENEKLKSTLKIIGGNEEKIKHLEEVRKRLQNDLMDINEKKNSQLNELKELKDQIKEADKSLQEVRVQIGEVNHTLNEKRNPFLSQSDETIILQKDTDIDEAEIELLMIKRKEVDDQLKEALIKKDILIGENIRLEETARELSGEIQKLKTQEETLRHRTENLKSEPVKPGFDRVYSKIEKLSLITEKIEAIKFKGKTEINEIQSRINDLTNEENAIQDRINLRLRELEEIENSTIKDSSAYKKASEEKLLSLIVEEQNQIESIEKNQKQIKELRDKIAELKKLEAKTSNDIEMRIEDLKSKEIELQGNLNLLQVELKDRTGNREKSEVTDLHLDSLLQQEQNLKDKITLLTETENIKKTLLNEINDNLSAKEIEFKAVSQDYEKQSNQLNEINFNIQKLADEVSLKQKELLAVVQAINSKTERIKVLRSEAEGFEEKVDSLKSEAEKLEKLSEETDAKVKAGRLEFDKLDDEKKKFAELIPALQKRRNEILSGNKNLEERFAELFQRFNKEISQANQKRNVLEQIILKKEKDVEEKDRVLNEKLGTLEDSERTFTLRQIEIDSFDDIVKTIKDQKELLKSDLIKLDESSIEKRTLNKDLKMETDFLQQKMVEIEKSIRELLSTSDLRFGKSTEKRKILDSEISEYESRLNELNLKIKDSMNELVELRTAVSRIKLEHEEHRISIAKFASIKKKLDDDIKKNQSLLNKYKQIREKIKIEQTTMSRIKETPDNENPSEEKIKVLSNKNDGEIFRP